MTIRVLVRSLKIRGIKVSEATKTHHQMTITIIIAKKTNLRVISHPNSKRSSRLKTVIHTTVMMKLNSRMF